MQSETLDSGKLELFYRGLQWYNLDTGFPVHKDLLGIIRDRGFVIYRSFDPVLKGKWN